MIWRSQNRGVSFEAPVLITPEGHKHFDQRLAVDAQGAIYVSYTESDGGAAIDASGRLHAVWAAGEPGYRTGTVWLLEVFAATRFLCEFSMPLRILNS
jgi:hypothetical protein